MSLCDLKDLPILFPRWIAVLSGTVLQDSPYGKPSHDVRAFAEPTVGPLNQERSCRISRSTPYGPGGFGSLNGGFGFPQL